MPMLAARERSSSQVGMGTTSSRMMPNMPRVKAMSGWRRTFVQESRGDASVAAAMGRVG